MKLLLTGCFNYSQEQKESLKDLGYDVYFIQQEVEELKSAIMGGVEVVVCNGLFQYHNINGFSNLKFVQLTSAGLDRVPVEKINERGIILKNAKGVYNIPMAEWALFRVLEHYKQGWFFKKEQECGRWTKHRGLREVCGTKVAVIGAGSVGQEVARLFKAFGAATCGFVARKSDAPFFDEFAWTSELKERIGEFDVVVVSAPLKPETFHLINSELIMSMKEGAMLVNVARGSLIDEAALCEVLAERKDLFAVLDVFEKEPLGADSPLWRLDNVALSPHNSFVGGGNNGRMFRLIYENLKDYIQGRL